MEKSHKTVPKNSNSKAMLRTSKTTENKCLTINLPLLIGKNDDSNRFGRFYVNGSDKPIEA